LKKISGFFRKTLWKILKNSKPEYAINFILNLAKHGHAKFQLSIACNQTGLDTFLTIFEENFWIFQENSLANSIKFQT
jgi:hypothetical protein